MTKYPYHHLKDKPRVEMFNDAQQTYQQTRIETVTYRKSSIKPPGGLFNFGSSRGGGLIERGAY